MRAKWRAIAAMLVGGLAVAGMGWIAVASQAGCQLQGTCDPSSAWWPGPTPTVFPNPTNVSLPSSGAIDDETWQSNALDDQWLFFPGGRTYTIFPFMTSDAGSSPRFFGPYYDFEISVGTDPQPATTGNFTTASGNLAEVSLVADPSASQFATQSAADAATPAPSFNVSNATCADYYMRVVVHRYPDAGGTPVVDAAFDAPAAVDASDAGGD